MPTDGSDRADLITMLMDTIDGVKAGKIDSEKARTIAELSKAVIHAEKFELDKLSFLAKHRKAKLLTTRAPLAITHDEEPEDEHDEDEEQVEPAHKPVPKASNVSIVKALLKTNQPLELKEIARRTKIPQAELFALLSDEKVFERESDGFYWLAK